MKTSAEGVALIKAFESFRPDAYLCPARVWTIGYGSTMNVKPGDTITEPQASARLMLELTGYERGVDRAVAECSQHQFDALVSFAFNVGIAGMTGSTVVTCHRRGDFDAAARAFSMWNKGGGKVLPGLVRRRAAEAALYLTPDDGEPLAMAQQVDPEKPMTASTINRAAVVGGGTAVVATVSETLRTVNDLKDSVSTLGDWLVPLLLVVTIGAIGLMVWQRLQMRRDGKA